MDTSRTLILPGDDEYEETIGQVLPFNWQEIAYKNFGEFCFIADANSKLLRTATYDEVDEYLYGGEYDALVSENPDLEDGFNESELLAHGML